MAAAQPLSDPPHSRAVATAGGFYRQSVFYFAALAAFAIASFWPSYFAVPKAEADYHVHLHGIAMFLWMALLIAQAWLIRAGRRELHRKLGKTSYVLVPVIAISTLLLLNYRVRTKGLDLELQYFFWVIVSLLIVFLVAYGMAMLNRHKPMLHARYMVCTALALVDPIFARLFFNHLGAEPPQMQYMTYVLADGILLLLAVVDWRAGRPRVFAAMLGVFIVAQVPTFFLPEMAGWLAFARWYGTLALP